MGVEAIENFKGQAKGKKGKGKGEMTREPGIKIAGIEEKIDIGPIVAMALGGMTAMVAIVGVHMVKIGTVIVTDELAANIGMMTAIFDLALYCWLPHPLWVGICWWPHLPSPLLVSTTTSTLTGGIQCPRFVWRLREL